MPPVVKSTVVCVVAESPARVAPTFRRPIGAAWIWRKAWQSSAIEHPRDKELRMASTAPLVQRPAWKALQTHYEEISSLHLRSLFAEDGERGERMAIDAAGIYFDYSK